MKLLFPLKMKKMHKQLLFFFYNFYKRHLLLYEVSIPIRMKKKKNEQIYIQTRSEAKYLNKISKLDKL